MVALFDRLAFRISPELSLQFEHGLVVVPSGRLKVDFLGARARGKAVVGNRDLSGTLCLLEPSDDVKFAVSASLSFDVRWREFPLTTYGLGCSTLYLM